MPRLFLITAKRFWAMSLRALTRSPDGAAPLRPRRVLVLLAFLPVFLVVQIIHWLGFLLDDLLFRGWRRVQVDAPVFVLGVPRSGTTRLHQVLAEDDRFTTFRTWECLFAPSVTQRRFWLGLGRLDAAVGRPLGRLLDWLEQRIFAGLDDVHAMSLRTPEEDYFALMPILSCFILALPFPGFEHIWRMGRFDRDVPDDERRLILRYYRDCLKRHLYVHGTERVMLSKNAAFAPLAQGLAAQFPDARFIVCLRDPLETVPSQLSSIADGLAFFGVPADSATIRARLVDQLAFYYENLDALRRTLPRSRHAALGMSELRAGLAPTLTRIYDQLGLALSPAFAAHLSAEDGRARRYRSRHHYSLEQFGLDAAGIARRFAAAYRHPALARPDPGVPETAGEPTPGSVARQRQATAAERSSRPHNTDSATEAASC
jgi:hypothetical protein